MKIYSVIFLLILAACSDSKDNKEPVSETVHANAETSDWSTIGLKAGCYEMINNADTTRLQLELRDSFVTGTMVYNISGKHDSVTKVTGVIRDSVLIVEISQGERVNEIVFLIDGDALISTDHKVQRSENSPTLKDVHRTYSRTICRD